MKDFFEKNNKVFIILFRNLFFTSILIFVLDLFFNIRISHLIGFNFLIFFVFFFSSLWLLFCIRENEEKFKKFLEPLFKFLFLFFLVLVTISSLDFEFINKIYEFKIIIDTLKDYSNIVFLVTGSCLFFLLLLNQQTILEKTSGKKDLFLSNKIYILLLFIILLSAFILRFLNLTILYPYTDEYIHLYTALEIMEKGSSEYTRANLVSYSVALFYWLGDANSFYEYLYWGRIPGIIFSTLTILPIYLLGKQLNKNIGLIASALWAISPWAIGIAKNIREYAYYPFFVLITAYAVIHTLDLLFTKPRQNIHKIIALSIYIISFIVYAIYIDTLSTLKISIPLILFIALYRILIQIKNKPDSEKFFKERFLKIIPLIVLFSIPIILYSISSTHLTLDILNYNMRWWHHIFTPSGSPMHWWFENPMLYIPHFILSIGLIYSLIKKDWQYFMYFSIFWILMFFYIFLFDRYVRPRYIFYVLPFFSILIATSIYALYEVIKKTQFKNKALRFLATVIFIAFIFSSFNLRNTLYPVFSDEHGYVKTTNEYHDEVKSTIKYLEENATEKDVFIATMPTLLAITLDVEREKIHLYQYREQNRFEQVKNFVKENPQGFMILDWRRNGRWSVGYPKRGTFTIGEANVEVVQNNKGFQIYRWERRNQ